MAEICRDESMVALGLRSKSSADFARWCDRAESSFEPERWRVDDWFEDDEEAVEPDEEEGWVAWPCLVGARVGWNACAWE